MKKAIRAAISLYRSFRDKEPTRVKIVDYEPPEAVAIIGYVEEICYVTSHGKKVVHYSHPFGKGSRPLLCASEDGRQLLLLGGNFEFGEQGIVDKDARGRPIYDPQHGSDDLGFMRRRQAD